MKSTFLKELIDRLNALIGTVETEVMTPAQIKGQIASIIEAIEARLEDEATANQIETAIADENDNLIEENAELRARLNQEEKIAFLEGIKFRKSKTTQNRWTAFCPACDSLATFPNADYNIWCGANCGWTADVNKEKLFKLVAQLS